MTRRSHPSRRRAFTLTEAMAVVVMVAVAVPPMAAVARSHGNAAGDAARRHTALNLAVGVLESVIADSESTAPKLGFEGLARPEYVDGPLDGLRVRTASLAEPAAAFGITWDCTIDPPIDSGGAPANFDDDGALRIVTVTARWTALSGRDTSLALKSVVVNR